MKTVIEMAREAGLHLPYWADDEDPKKDPPRWTMVSPLPPLLERFAELVRADEREACAQSLDKQADLACDAFDRKWAQEMAAAVRARWNT